MKIRDGNEHSITRLSLGHSDNRLNFLSPILTSLATSTQEKYPDMLNTFSLHV